MSASIFMNLKITHDLIYDIVKLENMPQLKPNTKCQKYLYSNFTPLEFCVLINFYLTAKFLGTFKLDPFWCGMIANIAIC